MMKKIYLLMMFVGLTAWAVGQTVLSAGDIAIFGVNADNPDDFGFVLLRDIESGTEIRFTDSGWKSNNTFRGNEGAVKYTAPTDLPAGTEITYQGNNSDFASDNDATVGTNGFNLSGSGDQVFAFQGSSSSPTFIYAVQTNSNTWQSDATASTNSAIPQGLTNGTNAVAVGAGSGAGDEYDNAGYDDATYTNTGSTAQLLSAISDNAKWTGNNSTRYSLTNYDFKISGQWTGTSSTSWSTSNNWDDNSIPTSSTDVNIPSTATNFPLIDGDATTPSVCNNLTIASGATLTIPAVKALTVYGDFTNNGTASGLVVQSTSAGNGSLIVEGSATSDVTVERYFAGYSSSSDGWHEVGVPVESMTVTGSDFEPGTVTPDIDDLYYWSEGDNLWMNWKTSSFDFNTVGKGYLVSYETTQTNSFHGTLTTTDYSFINLSRDNAKGKGWHLFGNAYSSALEWNNCSGWTFLNIGTIANIWDESSGTYTTVSAGGIIPSTTGFFLQVADGYGGNNELTIRSCGRVHNAQNNYKSSNGNHPKYTLKIKVTTTANTFSNTSKIAFKADATNEWDMKYDSHKLYGNASAPELWTVSNNEEFSLNTLPFSEGPVDLPLNFKAGADGSYTLNFEGLDSFETNSNITLEDLFTGQTTDLKQNPVYNYSASKGDANNRFVLHFYGVTSTPENSANNEKVLIYTYNNTIILKSIDEDLNGSVEVVNILGQTLDVKQVSHSNFLRVNSTLNHGIYFVRYKGSNGYVQTGKVILN